MEKEKWYVATVSLAGVQVIGTREEAQDTLNKLTSTIEELFRSHGISYIRKEQTIVRAGGMDQDGTPLPA